MISFILNNYFLDTKYNKYSNKLNKGIIYLKNLDQRLMIQYFWILQSIAYNMIHKKDLK